MHKVTRHPEPGLRTFLRRTIAAQIHLAALFASVIGTTLLVYKASLHGSTAHVLANLAFGITAALVFATSSVYHFLHDGFKISNSLEAIFENLDHVMIYLFIAGTYSAVLINTVTSPWAEILLVLVWCVAIFGIAYTVLKKRFAAWAQHRFVYTSFFLVMGWLFVFRIHEIVEHLSSQPLQHFVLGGLSYTVGAVVYATKRPILIKNVFGYHELWHVLVVLGYLFHYLLILSFY
jgi:hemolysin III